MIKIELTLYSFLFLCGKLYKNSKKSHRTSNLEPYAIYFSVRYYICNINFLEHFLLYVVIVKYEG